jgi:hypothetical protein
MFPVGFEPTIPASERPQTHAIDRTATGINWLKCYTVKQEGKLVKRRRRQQQQQKQLIIIMIV